MPSALHFSQPSVRGVCLLRPGCAGRLALRGSPTRGELFPTNHRQPWQQESLFHGSAGRRICRGRFAPKTLPASTLGRVEEFLSPFSLCHLETRFLHLLADRQPHSSASASPFPSGSKRRHSGSTDAQNRCQDSQQEPEKDDILPVS